jgi:hypothetical protein
MDQSDSRDWIPTDPVARKKATRDVKLTTGERFNEGSGEWEHGQWPHVFKVITDKKKELKPDNEFYWCWECRCGARQGGYGSTKTALVKGDSHSNLANRRKSKPIGREAAARNNPPPEAYYRRQDERDRRDRQQKNS